MKLTSSSRLNYLLGTMGIFSIEQVINHVPRRYESLYITKEENLSDKERVVLKGKIISPLKLNDSKKSKFVTFDFVTLNDTFFKVIAFNRAYLPKILHVNDEVIVIGTFDKHRLSINLVNIYKGSDKVNTLKPIYSLPEGFEQINYSKLVNKCFNDNTLNIKDDIPYLFINKYRLGYKKDCLYNVHFPKSYDDVIKGLRYLKYEEALKFSLSNQIIREQNKTLGKIKKEPIDFSLANDLLSSLPFSLTSDQENACKEILEDMNSNSLMYRLLQGDVGTGKTLVALVCLYVNRKRGDQGALMAPTDALARQHYSTMKEIFKNTKLNIALLTGATKSEEKAKILSDLEDGTLDIIVGTHSLFSKSVKYSSLGLAIIDEQHRFGVNQRTLLMDKGTHTDILMMSATPIPRSLALSIYGDLDISTLEVFPSKKRDVLTKIVSSDSSYIFKAVDKALLLNKSVYIVAPSIYYKDDDKFNVEQLFIKYTSKYKEKVGLLHGKMSQEDKEKVLNDFYSSRLQILVSTQVIEVGIDNKNAILMVIYDSSNFGLATLHQLRGRVGRDGSPSLCILTYDGEDSEKLERLNTLVKSNNGFDIAEVDLKLRGPGELSGIRQSGLPDFNYLNMIDDIKIFKTAREDAKYIIEHKNETPFSYLYNKISYKVKGQKDKLI